MQARFSLEQKLSAKLVLARAFKNDLADLELEELQLELAMQLVHASPDIVHGVAPGVLLLPRH
ncbi:hypothetical protein CJO93_20500 (plasmid) [Ralstonia solanacearum]|uniref:hypothetical protein n=1 Tax=Ralstonia pseudosolanacearum TaxID=1310165 RepID=UPI000699A785|nr:hypothetical protein [Ralstonia pseudosolanacearum]AXW59707.1 hypothetical protein CJO93_20500 [Ralstonia solanacearum]BCL86867.1 hypothetical protein MAFF211471_19500 [Ralstonia solanacearum]BCM99418.1 hypothetical protein RPSA_19550 [Ralstonia solanacearum]